MAERRSRYTNQFLNQPMVGLNQPAAQQPAPAESGPGVGGAIRDTALGIGAGVTGMAQGAVGISSLIPGADAVTTPAYEGLGAVRDQLQGWQTDATQQARGEVHGAWDSDQSFGENVGNTMGAIGENPYYLLGAGAEAIGSIGAFGKALKAADKIRGVSNLGSATKVGGLAGVLGTGTVAGEIASEDPDGYFNRYAALGAGAAYAGTAGLGARLGGAMDPKTVAGRLAGARLPGAQQGTGGAAAALPLANSSAAIRYPAYAALGATNEAAQEFVQSGSDVLFANLGLGRETWEGVDQAAVLGAVSGGLGGGATSMLAGRADKKTRNMLQSEGETRRAERAGGTPETAAPAATPAPAVIESMVERIVPEGAREATREAWARRDFTQDLSTADGAAQFLDALVPRRQGHKDGQEFSANGRQMRTEAIQHMFIRASEGTSAEAAQQAKQFVKGVTGDNALVARLENAASDPQTSHAQLAEVYGELDASLQSRLSNSKKRHKEVLDALTASGAEGSDQGKAARADHERLGREEAVMEETRSAVRQLQNRVASLARTAEEQVLRPQREQRREAMKITASHLLSRMGTDGRITTDILNQIEQTQPESAVEAFEMLSDQFKLGAHSKKGRPKGTTNADVTAQRVTDLYMQGEPEASQSARELILGVLTEQGDGVPEAVLPDAASGFMDTTALESHVVTLEAQAAQMRAQLGMQAKGAKAQVRKQLQEELTRLDKQADLSRRLLVPFQRRAQQARDAQEELAMTYDEVTATPEIDPSTQRALPAPPPGTQLAVRDERRGMVPVPGTPEAMAPLFVVHPDGTTLRPSAQELEAAQQVVWDNRTDHMPIVAHMLQQRFTGREQAPTRAMYSRAVRDFSGRAAGKIPDSEYTTFVTMWENLNTAPGEQMTLFGSEPAPSLSTVSEAAQGKAAAVRELLGARRADAGVRGNQPRQLDLQNVWAPLGLEPPRGSGVMMVTPDGTTYEATQAQMSAMSDAASTAEASVPSARMPQGPAAQASARAEQASAPPLEPAPAAEATTPTAEATPALSPEQIAQALQAGMDNPPAGAMTKSGARLDTRITAAAYKAMLGADVWANMSPQQKTNTKKMWSSMVKGARQQPGRPSSPKPAGRAEATQARPATAEAGLSADETMDLFSQLRDENLAPTDDVFGEVESNTDVLARADELDSLWDLDALGEDLGLDDGPYDGRFNLAKSEPTTPVDPDTAQQAIDGVLDRMPGAPRVVIVENRNSAAMPQTARDVFAQAERAGRRIKAFYHRGEIYVDPARHHSAEDVVRSVYHEVVGHHGLRGAMGEALNPVLDEIANARSIELMHYANKYKLDLKDPEQRREAAEEMVAAQAENLGEMGMLDRLMAHVRAWWADLTGQEYSDAQIYRDLLAPAAGFVAGRRFSDMHDVPLATRYRDAPDPASSAQLNDPDVRASVQADASARGKLGELVAAAKRNLMFTHRLIEKLERRLSAARDFRRSWDRQQSLGVVWERYHQTLGQKYVKLNATQAENVSNTLLQYSQTGRMPYLLQHAKRLTIGNAEGQLRVIREDLTEADVELDSAPYDALSETEQEVVSLALETMAELQMSQTELQINNIQRALGHMRETGRQTPQRLEQLEQQSLSSLVAGHNNNVVKSYVPQTRRGKFRVMAKSKELVAQENEAEQMGERPDSVPLARDPNHYEYVGADSASEASALVAAYKDAGWTHADHFRAPSSEVEQDLSLSDLSRLYSRLMQEQNDGDTSVMLSDQVEQEMLRLMDKLVADNESTVQSRMRRENVKGVKTSEILPNVLERTKDFGYYYAASLTAPARFESILNMRRQLSQLSGQDNVEHTQTFEQLIDRTQQAREGEGSGDWMARGALQFSSFQYLLSNPSYYALQLTQPFIMSAPKMAGEFGMAKTVGKMVEHYAKMKDVYKGITSMEQEMSFDSMPEHHRAMLKELQARNVLDVGMSQEFGVVGGNFAQNAASKAMRMMYNGARGVELVNRTATALAAYDLQMEKILKGRDPAKMDADVLQALQERATNYAENITVNTHGNYSFADAPGIFRNPIMRVMLQFKKIALIQAELMYETAATGWRKSPLSNRALNVLSLPELNVAPETLAKLKNKDWIAEAEYEALYDAAKAASEDATVLNQLSEQDQQFFRQLLQAELHPETFVTYESMQASRASFRWLLGTSGVLTGTMSIPFATAALAATLKMMDEGEEEDAFETDTGTITRVFGPEMGSFVLRGAMGNAVGVDISNRIGINFIDHLFGAIYENYSVADSDSGVKEAVYGFAGPTVNYVGDFTKGLNYLQQYSVTGSNHDLTKGLSSMAPLGIRNMLNANLWDRQGLVSDSRLQMLEPEQFTTGQIWAKRFGFQPSMVSELYDIKEHMTEVEQQAEHKRLLLKRSFLEANQEGDTARAAQVREMWKDLQEDQRRVGLTPSPASELQQFIRQKRREQQRSVAGLTTSNRNRSLTERIAAQHGYGAVQQTTAQQRAAMLRQGINPYRGNP